MERVTAGSLLRAMRPKRRERRGITVSRAQYGDAWPLTIESGILACDGPGSAVTLIVPGGKRYALNGRARGMHRWEDGQDILSEGMTGADLSGLVGAGLALCE